MTLLLWALPAAAQEGAPVRSAPLTIGTSYTLATRGAERRVHVVVPADYDAGERRYPLVVMLDGGLGQDLFLTLGIQRWNALWGRSAPAIFVGVETVDRQRELLPPSRTAAERARYPTAGEAAAFRAWLRTEVLPLVRARYRHDGRAILAGESAAGHFVVETWAEAPAMFTGYAAISPSLQWDGGALARRIAAAPRGARPPLFLSLANEGGATAAGVRQVAASLRSGVCFADRSATLFHANALHGLLPEALQYLLPTTADWLAGSGLTLTCARRQARPGVSASARG